MFLYPAYFQNLRLVYRHFLGCDHRICIDFFPIIVEIFTPKGTDTYTLARTGFFFFNKTTFCRDQYFCILNVYCVLRWKNIRDHFLCPHLCVDRHQYPAASSADRRQRDLAVRAGRGGDDTVSVDLLFLEEKRLLSLYKIEKNNVRVMSPDRKIAQIVDLSDFDMLNQLGKNLIFFFSGTSAR